MGNKHSNLIALPTGKRPTLEFTDADRLLIEDERLFKSAVGFNANRIQRISILTTKFQLSLSNEDVSRLEKASILKFPAFEEVYLAPKIHMFIFSIFETLLISGIFWLFSFVLFSKAEGQMSGPLLIVILTFALVGFWMFYRNTYQKVLPYWILKKRGIKFGCVFPGRSEN